MQEKGPQARKPKAVELPLEQQGVEQRLEKSHSLSQPYRHQLVQEVLASNNPEWASKALHSRNLTPSQEEKATLKSIVLESKDPQLAYNLLAERDARDLYRNVPLSLDERSQLLETVVNSNTSALIARILWIPSRLESEPYPWTPELHMQAVESLCASGEKEPLMTVLNHGFTQPEFTDAEKEKIKRAILDLKDPAIAISIYQNGSKKFSPEEKEELRRIVIESGDSEWAKKLLKYGRGLTPEEYDALSSIALQGN